MADGKDAKKRACHIYTHADMGEVNECRVVTTGPTFSRSCSENHRIMLLSNYIVTTRPTRLLFINLHSSYHSTVFAGFGMWVYRGLAPTRSKRALRGNCQNSHRNQPSPSTEASPSPGFGAFTVTPTPLHCNALLTPTPTTVGAPCDFTTETGPGTRCTSEGGDRFPNAMRHKVLCIPGLEKDSSC